MRKFQLIILMLWLLIPLHQAAWADGVTHLAFNETFNANNGTGGRDGSYSGTIASNNILYDVEGWSGAKSDAIYGGNYCMKFGSSSANGTCTTPEIILVGAAKTATLTFNAAGWGNGSNKLTVTANAGVTLSGDTQVTLTNSTWKAYTVTITLTTATYVQLTFSGKRGFLDDVKVVEEVTAINAPTLTEEHLFWPNTIETATKHITLVPSDSTTIYYTTDGTEPSKSNGHEAMLTSNISISGTTTVKAIAYYETVASAVVSKTYTVGSTVDGIAEFCNLSDDTEARIHFADDNTHETRVLYYDESNHQLFLRDKTGALCIDFGTTATFNPTPKYNQHIGGWIVGKKVTDNGLPKLVATENTTTSYLAIADRVTEAQTEPNNIANADLGSHYADWVTISEQRVGTDLAVVDRFGTTAYDGALADLSGIVIPNGSDIQIAPIAQNEIPAVVYVLDEDQAFVSPAEEVANATVRLKRTLSKDYWNTLTLPVDMAWTYDGKLRQFNAIDGNTMVFIDADNIEAGKPYLVKPAENIVNPVFTNVTLSATPAQNINAFGDYHFVGTYSPKELATDKSELFLTTNGKLGYPENDSKRTLKGMRAYIQVPQEVLVSLFIDGEATGINDVRSKTEDVRGKYFNLAGQRVAQPTKGIYIVNGKKIIIH